MTLSIRALTAGLVLVGCANPQPKETTAPSTSATVTAAAPPPASTTAPLASAAPSVDASGSASVAVPTAPPPLSTEKWTALATAKSTLALRYPADIFPKTKVAAESIVLLSNLTRAGLADDGKKKDFWRYQIQVDFLAGTPFDQVKKLFKTYPFPQMFPSGAEASYAEQPDGLKTTVAGHAGYRVHTGVEGYNEDTSLLAIEPKKTLRFRCTTVGGVMGPEIDEEKQLAVCDAVLSSLFSAKAP